MGMDYFANLHLALFFFIQETSNGTLPFIVSFPIKNGDFPWLLGLPTPKKYQSFCTIKRFIKFMVVPSVFPKS